jgi:hypothetical protein
MDGYYPYGTPDRSLLEVLRGTDMTEILCRLETGIAILFVYCTVKLIGIFYCGEKA